VRRPPIITWSDVRWILYVAAGVAFLYGVLWIVWLSWTLPGPLGGVVWGVAATVLVALIALELRRFWLRFRR
jgi:hypothetical protein